MLQLYGYQVTLWKFRRDDGDTIEKNGVIFKNQLEFILKSSTTKVIHLAMGLVEQYRKRKVDLHIVFINLEKIGVKVSKNVIWRYIGVLMVYTRVIKDIYDKVKTWKRIVEGDLEHFPVVIGFTKDQYMLFVTNMIVKLSTKFPLSFKCGDKP